MKSATAIFTANSYDDLIAAPCLALQCELRSLVRKVADINRYYWTYSTFAVDRIYPSRSDPSVTIYEVRLKGMRKTDCVLLQSDWAGMQFFVLSNGGKHA